MSKALAEQVRTLPSRRDPAYRPAMFIEPGRKERTDEKLGAGSEL